VLTVIETDSQQLSVELSSLSNASREAADLAETDIAKANQIYQQMVNIKEETHLIETLTELSEYHTGRH